MTSIFNLKVNTRNSLGSSNSRRIRKSGQIPAIIYNKNGANSNIVVDGKIFERQYFKGNIFTTPANIELDGKALTIIAHKIELNPVTDRPDHIDFVPLNKNETAKIKTKLNFINKDKSSGLKKGGFLHIVLRKIDVLCTPDLIPDSVDVDVASLKVGDKIWSQNLKLPEGVKLFKKTKFLIASIIGRGTKDDDEDKAESAVVATEGSAVVAGTNKK